MFWFFAPKVIFFIITCIEPHLPSVDWERASDLLVLVSNCTEWCGIDLAGDTHSGRSDGCACAGQCQDEASPGDDMLLGTWGLCVQWVDWHCKRGASSPVANVQQNIQLGGCLECFFRERVKVYVNRGGNVYCSSYHPRNHWISFVHTAFFVSWVKAKVNCAEGGSLWPFEWCTPKSRYLLKSHFHQLNLCS